MSAIDGAGNASAPSASVGATTPAAPPASGTATYGYDPASELTSVATPDGVTERSSYDRAGRLLEVANTETGGTLSRFTYGLDAAGNRTEQTTSVGTAYYGYDSLDRLTSACTGGSCVPQAAPLPCLACTAGTITRPAATISPNPSDTLTTWTYDPVGNRLTEVTYQGTTTYAYDAADRLTASTGPGATSYTYDANGNELSAGTATFGYDLADRMTSATVGATTQTYSWSGDGIRLSAATGPGAGTIDFLVDRNAALPQVALERDGTGSVVRDSLSGVGRIGIETAGVPTYEHTDALGSVTDLTNGSGTSIAWSEYAPYGSVRSAGSVTSAPADPFGFTGQYLDAPTGLYHLRARQYDPSIGRFLSVDPVSLPISDPYVAAYVYAQNNPAHFVDPSGRCPLCALVGGIIGGAGGFLGYTGSVVVGNLTSGNGLSVQGWDLGQAGVATATGAGAGAVCGVTAGLGCILASGAASEVQYQLSPGQKSPLGYLGAGTVGFVTGKYGGGPLADQGPLSWSKSLVGRMGATFGLGWQQKFEAQFVRTTLTDMIANTLTDLWNRLIASGDNGK